ncbi:hypothetical protein GZH46_02561, partial [Fragariocoptes setiger]
VSPVRPDRYSIINHCQIMALVQYQPPASRRGRATHETTLEFKSGNMELISKIFLSVAKFSRKYAYLKLQQKKITVSHNEARYWISATCIDNSQHYVSSNNTHRTYYLRVDPSLMNRIFKQASNPSRPSKLSIKLRKAESKLIFVIETSSKNNSASTRTITHTVGINYLTEEFYREKVEALTIQKEMTDYYDVKCCISDLFQFRHLMERFAQLISCERVYIWAKSGGDLAIKGDNQSSQHVISMHDLENGYPEDDDPHTENLHIGIPPRRPEAAVYIESKRLSTFLNNANPVLDKHFFLGVASQCERRNNRPGTFAVLDVGANFAHNVGIAETIKVVVLNLEKLSHSTHYH